MFREGEILDRQFRVISLIGSGGFGDVFLVEDFEQSLFALKTIRKEHSKQSSVVDRFRKESSIWLELNHPNIVRAYSFLVFPNCTGLLLEYVPQNIDGVNTLLQHLKFSSPQFEQILTWAVQFCCGMMHANTKGLLCHRDIKPDNLLISPDGSLKITDFGIAKLKFDLESNQIQSNIVDDTVTQGIIGTFSYMSPEQILEPTMVDQLSDVYSFGMVLYELVSGGKRPFQIDSTNSSTQEFLARIFDDRVKMNFNKMDSPLWPVIERCLQYEKNLRFQSFSELFDVLNQIYLNSFSTRYNEPTIDQITIQATNDKAWGHLQLGNFALAEKYSVEVLQLNPDDISAQYNLGVLNLNKGENEVAIDQFKRTAEFAPNNAEIWSSLGIAYSRVGQIDLSIKCYLTAISIKGTYAPFWYNLGFFSVQQGALAAAIRAFDTCVKFDPSYYLAWLSKARCHEKLHQSTKATEAYEEVVRLESSDLNSLRKLGELYQAQGRIKLAKNAYERALAVESNDSKSLFELAMIDSRIGLVSEAVDTFTIFLNLSSPNDLTRNAIANEFIQRNRRE